MQPTGQVTKSSLKILPWVSAIGIGLIATRGANRVIGGASGWSAVWAWLGIAFGVGALVALAVVASRRPKLEQPKP